MNVTISHPNSSFTGTITVLETVAVGFTNGVASVDIPPQAIAVFGSMPGFSYTYGAPSPAPPYDANLDVTVNAILGNGSSASRATLGGAFVTTDRGGQQAVEHLQASALRRIRADLALAHQKRVNALFVGHSMNGGYAVTKVADMLHAAYAASQARVLGLTHFGHLFPATRPTANMNPGVTDWPTTKTAPNLATGGFGLPPQTDPNVGSATWLGTFGGTTYGPVTVAVPQGVSALGIWTAAVSAQPQGVFQYTVDAGAAVTVDTAADGPGDADFKRCTVVPLDGAAHTVTISGNTGLVAFDGVEFLSSAAAATAGVHAFADARPGSSTSTMLTNLVPNYTGANGVRALAGWAPSLIVFTGLCNDYSQGTAGANPVPSATTKTNLASILSQLVGACSSSKKPSVIINIELQRNTVAMTEPWSNYVQTAYQVAAENGYAIFDGGAAFGGGIPTPAVTAGLVDGDTIHPTPAGMWTWGLGLSRLASPR
jgi:lysophospholipase L1-like esterase